MEEGELNAETELQHFCVASNPRCRLSIRITTTQRPQPARHARPDLPGYMQLGGVSPFTTHRADISWPSASAVRSPLFSFNYNHSLFLYPLIHCRWLPRNSSRLAAKTLAQETPPYSVPSDASLIFPCFTRRRTTRRSDIIPLEWHETLAHQLEMTLQAECGAALMPYVIALLYRLDIFWRVRWSCRPQKAYAARFSS